MCQVSFMLPVSVDDDELIPQVLHVTVSFLHRQKRCVVLAAVHLGSLLTPPASASAGYRDNYIPSSYWSSLPALALLLLAAITLGKRGL
eukprot:superscaffoldBa00008791_g23627